MPTHLLPLQPPGSSEHGPFKLVAASGTVGLEGVDGVYCQHAQTVHVLNILPDAISHCEKALLDEFWI